MHLGGDIKRGRPSGRITIAKRKALDYVLRQEAKGKPIVLGEMVRQCGFSCRSNARRTLNGLQKIGVL